MADVRQRLAAALAARYRVEEESGRGGMATVYRAYDVKLRRAVAIKVLHPNLTSSIAAERFLREIEIAAGLAHPHILPLYDSGEADGLLYYIMPFVEGETLRAWLDREPQLSIDDAVRVTCEIAEALGYAHSLGVVHRDIKPDNILIQNGRAVVADFGIARALTAATLEPITAAGAMVGTPAYASPEQATTDTQADSRADIYSLGCVLYEMLVGLPPFDAATPQAVLARHALDPVPPIRTVRPTVPEAVERAVRKALSKVPADRYATAAQFVEALRDRSVHLDEDVAAESVAVLPFVNLDPESESQYFSDGITEEITNALAQLPGLHVAARTSAFVFRGGAFDLKEVGAKLKVATVLEGSVRRAGTRLRVTAQLINVADGFHLWSEQYDRELTDVFAIQGEIARAIAERLRLTFDKRSGASPVHPQTKNLDAYHLYLKGRFFWAQRGLGLKAALECFGQALALDPDYALAHAGLADACTLLAEYGLVPPAAILPKARMSIQRALELAPDLAEAHSASGTVKFVFDWNWVEAAKDLRRAIELNPRYVFARYRLGLYLALVESRYEEALLHAQRAVDLDPLAPLPAAQLGMVYIAAGRLEDAATALRRSAELGPTMLLPHLHLGATYYGLGLLPEAIATLEIASAASGRYPVVLGAMAMCYRALGKTADVEAICDELAARARKDYVQPSSLAVAFSAAGRIDEAFTYLDRSCNEFDATLVYSRCYPGFEVLREDARMEGVYRRIGFPGERP